MTEINTILWDLGGVVLTDAWDHTIRRKAAEHFNLDWEDFEERHDQIMTAFETGRLPLMEYLERTVFYRPRPFTADQFRAFMFAQSQPHPNVLSVLGRLADSGKYLLGALNNESLELNLYRIEHFDLRRYFTLFFSSCFVGMRKPEEAIYRLALQVTQHAPEECLFIDDRVLNLEGAQALGIQTFQYQNTAQLQHDLQRNGVEI